MTDLTDKIAGAVFDHTYRGHILGCTCGWEWPHEMTYACGEDDRITRAHAAHVAEAVVSVVTAHTTVETVEALDALPAGSVVRESNGHVRVKHRKAWHCDCANGYSYWTAREIVEDAALDDHTLTVLFRPDGGES